jgi:hypothetical protein
MRLRYNAKPTTRLKEPGKQMRLPVIVALVLACSPALAEEPIELSLEEFKMFTQYKNALADPRVQKMKPESRLGAIAKDAGFKPKELQKAIDKGEAAGDVKAKCETNLKEALAKGDLAGRVGKMEIDTSDPHAVAYVQWLNENPAQLEEEASFVAPTVATACPIISTIQVWAQDKANPNARVFQALISGSAAVKIKPEKAKDFADTRYIRLFEKVKNAANGDDLSAATGNPTGKAGQ